MNVTQFQFEPAVTAHDFRYFQRLSRFASAGQSVHGAIDALMLGLRLRGWLTDDDKELLDRLAADNYLTFLIKGQSYLHPEGLDLFPIDLIQTARPEAAGALFKHHYQPKADPHCGGYVVHSAFIDESGTEPITLGMFGGNRPSRQNASETYFAELVERFRQAARHSEEFIHRHGQIGDSNGPVMILDRCSGRLFHTNRAAEILLGRSGRSLVGREFHEIKEELSSLIGQFRWTLRNLGSDDRLYTVISLDPVNPSSDSHPRESTPQFFVHKIRNKIAAITTAASHIRTLSSETENQEAHEMADLIVSESGQLNDLIGNFHVLVDHDQLPKRTVDASILFDEVLDQEVATYTADRKIESVPSIDGINITASVPALKSLFAAIIRAHTGARGDRCSRWLRIDRPVSNGCTHLQVSSGSDLSGSRPVAGREWRQYADELASLMHVGVTWIEADTGESLITTIELID